MTCGVWQGGYKGEWPSTGDAGVPWPAAQHVDEQVGAQVAQRDAPVREQLAALALERLHGGDEAQPHVAPEHRVAAMCMWDVCYRSMWEAWPKKGFG